MKHFCEKTQSGSKKRKGGQGVEKMQGLEKDETSNLFLKL